MAHDTLTASRESQCRTETPTGIKGFDDLASGGLPAGRASLVCGPHGSGKTVFAMSFLVNGALEYGDSGVYFGFDGHLDDPAQRCPDLLLARRHLGWEPRVSLDAGLRKTIAYFADTLEARAPRPSADSAGRAVAHSGA